MLLFQFLSVVSNCCRCCSWKFHILYDLAVILKEFYSIPSLLILRNRYRKQILHFVYCCLKIFGEDLARKFHFLLLCNFNRFINQICKTCLLQCRSLDDRASEKHGKTLHINLDSSLCNQICHVQCDHNRNTCLDQLSCQIKVTLNICCIHQINDDIRILI